MYGNVQRTRWSREKGQFLVTVDSQVASVVNAVTDKLREEFTPTVANFQHLVWRESHPEHSVLVVTPVAPPTAHLECAIREAMRRHLRSVLAGRATARAS